MEVIITLVDLPDGRGVDVSCQPSLDEILEKAKKPGTLTSAEGYAMLALLTIRRESQQVLQERVCQLRGGLH